MCEKPQFVQQHAIERVGHQQHQRVIAGNQRQHRFTLCHRPGHHGQGRRIGGDVAGVHGVVAQPRGNNLAQLLLGQDTVIHQDLPY